jgi:biopolymer transport protein ExbD
MNRYRNTQSVIGAICDINTTPLVDVMLVLLIIFMITAPVQQHYTPVKLPAPSPLPPLPPPEIWLLEISAAGNNVVLTLQGQAISLNQLPGKITEMQTRREKTELSLRTDPNASYGAVAKVLAAIKRAGADNIRFDELRSR